MCTYSAGCLVISPSSGHGGAAANNIPYSIALLDAQGSTVSAVPTQKQPPQIGRLAADNRKEFRVRALGVGRQHLVASFAWPEIERHIRHKLH